MSKTRHHEEHTPKIVRLYADQEQADAVALARYWDARLEGRPSDATEIDPELRDIVQLLEHYREGLIPLVPPKPGPTAVSPPLWLRSAQVAALALVMVMLLLFTGNTLLSPRSWLLSSTQDPDWIPWVSDDWLGAHALTADSIRLPEADRLEMTEDLARGA